MSKFIWIKITNTLNNIYKSRHYFDLAFVNGPVFPDCCWLQYYLLPVNLAGEKSYPNCCCWFYYPVCFVSCCRVHDPFQKQPGWLSILSGSFLSSCIRNCKMAAQTGACGLGTGYENSFSETLAFRNFDGNSFVRHYFFCQPFIGY